MFFFLPATTPPFWEVIFFSFGTKFYTERGGERESLSSFPLLLTFSFCWKFSKFTMMGRGLPECLPSRWTLFVNLSVDESFFFLFHGFPLSYFIRVLILILVLSLDYLTLICLLVRLFCFHVLIFSVHVICVWLLGPLLVSLVTEARPSPTLLSPVPVLIHILSEGNEENYSIGLNKSKFSQI